MNRITKVHDPRVTCSQEEPVGFLLHCVGPGQQELRLRLSAAGNNRISISVLDERLCSCVRSLRMGRIVGVPSGTQGTNRHWWFPTQAVRDSFDEFVRSDLVVFLRDRTSYRIKTPLLPALSLAAAMTDSPNRGSIRTLYRGGGESDRL